jgi:filamentous hemagglutinin family protein
MNKVYRLIWSKAKERWEIVAEIITGKGGPAGVAVAAALVSAALALCATSAQALPGGGQVASGQATISTPSGSQMNISQGTGQAIINWNSFSIGKGETVAISQPSSSATLLNRVLGNDPSRIFGSLTANGRVFLVNPGGVLFAPGASVNVGGLVASSLDIKDGDFLAGKYSFSQGGPAASVVNRGKLTGGFVALLGSSVQNAGTIVTTRGTTGLAAGSAITLGFDPGGLVAIKVDAAAYRAQVNNSGIIEADGGTVLMTAAAADALLATVVNNSGVVRAGSMVERGGEIVLEGAHVVNSGTLDASGLAGDGGGITLQASGSLSHTGSIRADAAPDSGGKGGTVSLVASLANPASLAQIDGVISARAGSKGGNGGFVETSAATVQIGAQASVNTLAAHGKSGTWLIDPVDFTIAAAGGNMTGAALSDGLTRGNVSILSSSGTSGTAGDVNVNDVVSWSNNKLTLNAQNNINLNANLNGSGGASLALEYGQKSVAAGNGSEVVIHAPVNLPDGPNFSTKLGSDGAVKNFTVITALGLAGSVTGGDLQGMQGGLATNYALGGDIDASETSGWNAGAGFTPVGTLGTRFSGSFEGLGHSVSGLVINRPASSEPSGLFGATSSEAEIRNLTLSGGSIVGADQSGSLVGYNRGVIENVFSSASVSATSRVGGLVGVNDGWIAGSAAQGGVSGGDDVGGLAGGNGGTVTGSHATGSVTGAHATGGLLGRNSASGTVSGGNYATGDVQGAGDDTGGLIGHNNGTVLMASASGNVSGAGDNRGGLIGYSNGPISESYATGNVTGSADHFGGLVGYNSAGISQSYATGSVSGTGIEAGGLVGLNTGSIANSYASGLTTGASLVGGLVGSNTSRGTIANSYALGGVAGSDRVGGLVGGNAGVVSASFWDTANTGVSDGGTGLSDPQMMQLASFAGWNSDPNTIADTGGSGALWRIYEGHSAPLLTAFLTVYTLSDAPDATVVYNAAPQSAQSTSLGGVSGAAATGTRAGFYNGYYSNQQGYDIVGGNLTVTRAPLAVTGVSAESKVYDGTNVATLSGTAAVAALGSDNVALGGLGAGAFADKRVGDGRTVTVTGYTILGAEAGNYTLVQPTGLTASITPADLTVSGLTATGKMYDGNRSATLSGSAAISKLGTDDVSLGGTGSGSFADKNVGTGKTVSVTGYSISGSDAGNYHLVQPTGVSADIGKAALTVSATGTNKTYDGTTSAAVTLADNRISGDTLTLSHGSASFLDKNAAAGKTVNVTGINITGTDAGNYTFNTAAVTSADIGKAALTISATGTNKIYDGTTSAAVTLADNRISGDTLTLSHGSASFLDKNAAAGKIVNVAGIAVTGTDAGNYTFNTAAVTSADIGKAHLTVTADDKSRTYGAANPALTTTLSGFLNGENASSAAVSGTGSATTTATPSTAVGTAVITAGAGSLSATNYDFTTLVNGTLTISSAQNPTPHPPVAPMPPSITPVAPIPVPAPTAPVTITAPAVSAATPVSPIRQEAPAIASAPAPVILPAAPEVAAPSSDSFVPGEAGVSADAGQNPSAPPAPLYGSGMAGFLSAQPLALESISLSFVYPIPESTFPHSDPNARVEILARMDDGSPLPRWMLFDPARKIVSGSAPKGTTGAFRVMLIARDQLGQEAVTILTITIGG